MGGAGRVCGLLAVYQQGDIGSGLGNIDFPNERERRIERNSISNNCVSYKLAQAVNLHVAIYLSPLPLSLSLYYCSVSLHALTGN